MSTRTLLTIEQFERLPKPDVGSYELDQGELIYVSPNDLRHNRVRDKLYMPLREFVSRQFFDLLSRRHKVVTMLAADERGGLMTRWYERGLGAAEARRWMRRR